MNDHSNNWGGTSSFARGRDEKLLYDVFVSKSLYFHKICFNKYFSHVVYATNRRD